MGSQWNYVAHWQLLPVLAPLSLDQLRLNLQLVLSRFQLAVLSRYKSAPCAPQNIVFQSPPLPSSKLCASSSSSPVRLLTASHVLLLNTSYCLVSCRSPPSLTSHLYSIIYLLFPSISLARQSVHHRIQQRSISTHPRRLPPSRSSINLPPRTQRSVSVLIQQTQYCHRIHLDVLIYVMELQSFFWPVIQEIGPSLLL